MAYPNLKIVHSQVHTKTISARRQVAQAWRVTLFSTRPIGFREEKAKFTDLVNNCFGVYSSQLVTRGENHNSMERAEPQARDYTLYAVVAILLASILWPRVTGSKPDTLSETITACLTFVTFLSKAIPRKKSRGHIAAQRQSFRLAPSFMSGWYGGIVGGAIAGIIIGPTYYSSLGNGNEESWKEFLPLVFGYAVLVGFFFGATSQLGAQFARYLAASSVVPGYLANEVTGGSLGGALGGAIAGAYGGWIFGYRPTPLINPVLLSFASVVGAFAVCGGALLYEYRGRLKDVARVFFYSLIPTLSAAIIGFYVLVARDIGFNYFSSSDDRIRNLVGGAYMGTVVGATLGIQVGCTLLFYRLTHKREDAQ